MRTTSRLRTAAVSAGVLLLAATGCVFLESSNSISESVSASFGAISASVAEMSASVSSLSESTGGEDDVVAAYRRDVSDLTHASVLAGSSSPAFLRDLSRVAEAHGITDWELERDTYRAIGRGLRSAGVDAEDYARFEAGLVGTATPVRTALREGYGS